MNGTKPGLLSTELWGTGALMLTALKVAEMGAPWQSQCAAWIATGAMGCFYIWSRTKVKTGGGA